MVFGPTLPACFESIQHTCGDQTSYLVDGYSTVSDRPVYSGMVVGTQTYRMNG
jgi:hypothetical protein